MTDLPFPPSPPEAEIVVDGLPARFASNALINYAANAVIALSALVVTPLIIGHLGESAFGVWSLAGSVIAYIELFEFGFGTATVKLVAEDAYRRPASVVTTINTTFFLLSVLGLVALVTGLGIAFAAPNLFSVPDDLRNATVIVFAVLSVTIAASVPLDVIGGALVGHQRYDIVGAVTGIGLALLGVLNVAVVLVGGGIVALAIVNGGMMVAMQGVRWRHLKRIVPDLRLSPRLIDRGRIPLIARMSGWFLGREIAGVVIHRIDLVVVGVMLGVRAAAVYAVGAKLAMLARRAVEPVSKLFFPHAAAVSDDASRLRAIVVDGTRVTLLVGVPVALVLALLARKGIEVWVGSGFGDAVAVLILLAVAEAIFSVTETCWHVLAGSGRVRLSAIVAIAVAVANVGLSIALARDLGPPGVALGTVIAAAVIDLPAAIWFACREANLSIGEFARRSFVPHLVPAAGSAGILVVLAAVIPTAIFPVVLAGAAGVGVYFALYALVGATPIEQLAVRHLAGTLRERTVARAAPTW